MKIQIIVNVPDETAAAVAAGLGGKRAAKAALQKLLTSESLDLLAWRRVVLGTGESAVLSLAHVDDIDDYVAQGFKDFGGAAE